MDGPATPRSQRSNWWKPVLKWTLFVVVLTFIVQRALAMWRDAPAVDVELHSGWLLASAVTYALAWLPCVAFWRSMLAALGHRVSWRDAIHAYYVGHLGKYVPGKAMVLVLRASLLRTSGCPGRISAITATYETLVTMGAGAAIVIVLAPVAAGDELWRRLPAWLQPLRDWSGLSGLLVLSMIAAGLPLIARLFTRIARRMTPAEQAGAIPGISTGMLARGLAVVSLGWLLQAVSLGCTLHAVGAGEALVVDFPLWLLAVTISTVGGFVVLVAPGGLGVREFLLTETLLSNPALSGGLALIVAGLTRIIGFLTELFLAGVLTVWSRLRRRGQRDHR